MRDERRLGGQKISYLLSNFIKYEKMAHVAVIPSIARKNLLMKAVTRIKLRNRAASVARKKVYLSSSRNRGRAR